MLLLAIPTWLTLTLVGLAIMYVIGAVLAVIVMKIVDCLILMDDSKYTSYDPKEYIYGFIMSWVTVYVVLDSWINENW